jgi:AcrR family transcriptional regulator
MSLPTASKQQVLAVLTAATQKDRLAGLSMGELADAAGVSRATLYRLFPGKEALFAALVRSFSPFEPIAAVLEAAGDQPPAKVIPKVAHAMAAAMDGHMGLLLQLLFEVSRGRHPGGGHGAGEGAVGGMRTLPLVTSYLAGQMAAGRLRRMDPDLAFQALAGPIVLHLLWRPPAAPRADGPPARPRPLDEVVDELVGVWLRAMATGEPAAPQAAASPPPPPRRKQGG